MKKKKLFKDVNNTILLEAGKCLGFIINVAFSQIERKDLVS